MARMRNAPTTQQSTHASKSKPSARKALTKKMNTAQLREPVYEDDGNTEGLVRNTIPKPRRSKQTQQSSDDLVMAGGLGMPASEDARTSSEAPRMTDEFVKSDDLTRPVPKPNKRPPRTVKKVKQTEAQSKVLEGLKQRMQATAHGQKGQLKKVPLAAGKATAPPSDNRSISGLSANRAKTAAAERSEFSLSPSPSPSPPPPPPADKLSAVKAKRMSNVVPSSALRAQGTPAIESSILALKNFKRRPRQPSMLQMVQQKTASARPSLANTVAEKTAVDDSSVFDLYTGHDDLDDDFAPEAEGTPLRVRKANSSASSRASADKRESLASMTTSRKRKSDDVHQPSSAQDILEAKRLKSMGAEKEVEVHLPLQQEVVIVTQSSSERPETPQPPITSDVQVANSPSTSTPPTEPPSSNPPSVFKENELVIPSTEPGNDEPEQADDGLPNDDITTGIMADPVSSSPLRGSPSESNYLTNPATVVSPIAAKPKPKKKAKPMSTAMLQSLLPKKRAALKPRHRKSEYDFESDSDEDVPLDASHLEEDEDELGGRLRQRKKDAGAKVRRGRPRKSTNAARQSSIVPTRKSAATTGGKMALRTYGRTPNSDKENNSCESSGEEDEGSTLPEISISMQEAVKSTEIEEAKRKFADIDKWDMQFETVSVEEHHRSSSQDWR